MGEKKKGRKPIRIEGQKGQTDKNYAIEKTTTSKNTLLG